MARYLFGNTLGSGGFGIVREATRIDDGYKCVAKFLKDDHDKTDLLRFKREVRIQAQMDHPNIVPIIGMNLSVDQPWFIMPRALMNLREYLQSKNGEDELWIFKEVSEGVKYAHDNGVIHRDLKPENVLLYASTDGLYAAVSDFGLGRLINRDTPTLTQSHIGMGTIEYVAPEQWREAKAADEKADIYSLGKILYELLTGKIPYPSLDLNSIPKNFCYIIQKAVDNDPSRRYQTVAALLDDLDLVTRKRNDFEKPAETALQLLRNLVQEERYDSTSVESFARFLFENTNDYQMLINIVPRIPDPILVGLLDHHLNAFKVVLKEYDAQVSGSLTFSYCDVVADFYDKLFRWSSDIDIRIMILQRLPLLGYSHNRWHVGKVFARLMSNIDDPTLIMAVRDVLSMHPNAADWCKSYFQNVSLPAQLKKFLK